MKVREGDEELDQRKFRSGEDPHVRDGANPGREGPVQQSLARSRDHGALKEGHERVIRVAEPGESIDGMTGTAKPRLVRHGSDRGANCWTRTSCRR